MTVPPSKYTNYTQHMKALEERAPKVHKELRPERQSAKRPRESQRHWTSLANLAPVVTLDSDCDVWERA